MSVFMECFELQCFEKFQFRTELSTFKEKNLDACDNDICLKFDFRHFPNFSLVI